MYHSVSKIFLMSANRDMTVEPAYLDFPLSCHCHKPARDIKYMYNVYIYARFSGLYHSYISSYSPFSSCFSNQLTGNWKPSLMFSMSGKLTPLIIFLLRIPLSKINGGADSENPQRGLIMYFC